jgi:hypothetical protein
MYFFDEILRPRPVSALISGIDQVLSRGIGYPWRHHDFNGPVMFVACKRAGDGLCGVIVGF